jgi:hypothetical protein
LRVHRQVLGFALLQLARNLKRDLLGLLQIGLARGASDINPMALYDHSAMPETDLHVLAPIEGDLAIRDDMLLERMGHAGFPGRHEKAYALQ